MLVHECWITRCDASVHRQLEAADEEGQRLQEALRAAQVEAAAARSSAHSANIDADDARQQRDGISVAWEADSRQQQEAAESLHQQLAGVRAAAAFAQADAAAAAEANRAAVAEAELTTEAATVRADAAEARAAQLRAALADAERVLQDEDLGFARLPERNDRLDWVAADVAAPSAASSPAAVAAAVVASPEAEPAAAPAGGSTLVVGLAEPSAAVHRNAGEKAALDGGPAQRQDVTVTELHMQVAVLLCAIKCAQPLSSTKVYPASSLSTADAVLQLHSLRVLSAPPRQSYVMPLKLHLGSLMKTPLNVCKCPPRAGAAADAGAGVHAPRRRGRGRRPAGGTFRCAGGRARRRGCR